MRFILIACTMLVLLTLDQSCVFAIVPMSELSCDEPDVYLRPSKLGESQRGPICGLLSMKVASTSLSVDLHFSEILSSRYVTDANLGSSSLDLVHLANDAGLYAHVFQSLNIDSLRLLDSPALLNLKLRSDHKCGGHWVVFLGFEDGDIFLYDSLKNSNLLRIKATDLLTRWNGHTICISARPLSTYKKIRIGFSAIAFRLVVISICLAFIVALNRFNLNSKQKVLGILAISIATTFVTQSLEEESLFANLLSAKWMTSRSIEAGIASFEDFMNAGEIGNLVDARTETARAVFEVPHAISIPINCDLSEFRRSIAFLDNNSPVVVFCHSKSCSWADKVASILSSANFRDVRVFRRGVVGYMEEISLRKD